MSIIKIFKDIITIIYIETLQSNNTFKWFINKNLHKSIEYFSQRKKKGIFKNIFLYYV